MLNTTEELIKILSVCPVSVESTDGDVVGDFLLPYSVGIEIEAELSISNPFNIPNLLHIQVDTNEQRFRIPSGLIGLKCLWEISNQMYKYCHLNIESGNHYHIDFTDIYDEYITENSIKQIKDYLLTELDTWNYKGTYNSRTIEISRKSIWVNFNSNYKTMEVRIGEMTFDYEVLFKRITHLMEITKEIKKKLINYDENTINYEEKIKKRTINIYNK